MATRQQGPGDRTTRPSRSAGDGLRTMQRPGVRLFCCAVVAGLALPSSPVQAQSSPSIPKADTKPSNVVEDVVVTARKRSENVQKVPVAVTALSGAQLKNQSVKTIANLQGLAPGLVLQEAASDPQSLLFLLRGREQTDVTLAIDSSVGLYVDGRFVPRAFGVAGSLLDVNRVEVLRGPQGTLYGKNTTGGALVLYTNDPTDQYFASLDATAGSYGAADIVAIANLPINPNLAARFVVQRGTESGYGQNAIGDSLLSEKSQTYRGKLRGTWGDGWSAVLSAGYQSYVSGGPILNLIGLSPASPGQAEGGTSTFETELETGKTEAQSIAFLNSLINQGHTHFYNDPALSAANSYTDRKDVGLTINGDLGQGLNFVSISGFQQTHRSAFYPSPVQVSVVSVDAQVRDAYYSQEFQLLGHEGPFKWVAGIYGDYENGYEATATRVVPAIFALFGAPSLSHSNNMVINASFAPFGQATWEFIPTWRLTGGVRYSTDVRQINAVDTTEDPVAGITCVIPAPGTQSTALPGAKTQCPRTFKNTFGSPSWLLSMDHQVTPNVLAYAKVAAGYRSGGQNEGGSTEIESFAPFQPETNLEYEVGVKTELFDRRLRLNLAAYHDDYSNLQVTTGRLASDGAFVTLINNAASAAVQGLESEADVVVAPGVKLHSAIAYTDAHYNRFIDAQLGDRSHESFGVPKWTVDVNANYTRPMSFGDLFFEIDYNWKSAINLAPESTDPSLVTQAPVGLVDLRASVHFDRYNLDIAAFGKNVTSEKYYVQAATFAQLGITLAYAGLPATYGVEVIKKF